ncbi:MAG: hypothetical protein Q9222_005348 [Ikaeria aurantiellina]
MDLTPPSPPRPRVPRPTLSSQLSRTTSTLTSLEARRDNDYGSASGPNATLRRGHSDGDVFTPNRGGFLGNRRANGEIWMDFLRDSSRLEEDAEDRHTGPSMRSGSFHFREGRQDRQAALQRAAYMLADRKRRLAEYQEDHARRHPASSLPSGSASIVPESTSPARSTSRASIASQEQAAGASLINRPLPRRPDAPHSRNRESRDIPLPRWQPDSEVATCPICGTSFSFWYRKHHCRKCGRVVCANCSPHRITIPRQFIVQLPQDADQVPATGPPAGVEVVDLTEDHDGDAPTSQQHCGEHDTPQSPIVQIDPALGGGQEVRLCNPCVPDPNPLPHLPFESPGRFELRSFPMPDFTGPRASSNDRSQRPISNLSRRSSSMRHSFHHPEQANLGVTLEGSSNASGNGALTQHHHIPPYVSRHIRQPPGAPSPYGSVPNPSLHDALPPKGANGSETVREAHVADCIEQHFSTSIPRSARPLPSAATEAAVAATAASTTQTRGSTSGNGVQAHHERRDTEGTGQGGSSSSSDAFQRMGSQRRRVAGMVTYLATEKDCIGEEGEAAECVICFEEFEQGVEMGRLECLCKFHKVCHACGSSSHVFWFDGLMHYETPNRHVYGNGGIPKDRVLVRCIRVV